MNPITALVTVVFALIGGAFFTLGQLPAAVGFGVLAVLTAYSLKMANN